MPFSGWHRLIYWYPKHTVFEPCRLIGYENRLLAREDFNNDKIDAGDIGAGHTVTALYEVVLAGSGGERVLPLRYGAEKPTTKGHGGELAFLRLRYKTPDVDTSQLMEQPIQATDAVKALTQTSEHFRFAAAVAGFGQLLRGAKYTEAFTYDDVLNVASGAKGGDPFGYRGEFVGLVALAKSLTTATATADH